MSRNDVFHAAGDHDPRLKETHNQAQQDLGFDIPVETVPLPSQGKIYSEDNWFYNKETIDIKSMTANEEDILASQAYIKKGTVIEELIKSCVMNRDANVDDLVIGDRNAVSIAIRITGYGSDYTVVSQCANCSASNDVIVDLSELEIKRLTIEPVSENETKFIFTANKINSTDINITITFFRFKKIPITPRKKIIAPRVK